MATVTATENKVNKYKVGDSVAIVSGLDSRTIHFHTIERVMKRFVELEDGSKFTPSGLLYPRRSDPDYSHMFPRSRHLEDMASHMQSVSKLRQLNWRLFDHETLSAILTLLEKKTQAGTA